MIQIQTVKQEDLTKLASLYVSIYSTIPIEEHWNEKQAYQLMEYFYQTQPDLFLCAYDNQKPIGAIMSIIKPYWNGIILSDTEIFVSNLYQGQSIGKELIKKHLALAKEKHGATYMSAHTYENENGYPLKWYQKIGYEVPNNFVIINGKIDTILSNLNPIND